MKKICLLVFVFYVLWSSGQEKYSFETSEGYSPGNINGQAGWFTYNDITGQTISDELATDGFFSLKISKESAYPTQSNLVLGAFKDLNSTLLRNDFKISLNINISQLQGSDFAIQGINTSSEYYVFYLRLRYNGTIVVMDNNGGNVFFGNTSHQWNPQTWYNIMVEGNSEGIKYYMNNQLVYSGKPASDYDIEQIGFTSDNYSGSAYFDDIQVGNEITLDTEFFAKKEYDIYPNPASDFIFLKGDGEIKKVNIYDRSGRMIKPNFIDKQIDIRNLKAGYYIISFETPLGIIYKKFIKK